MRTISKTAAISLRQRLLRLTLSTSGIGLMLGCGAYFLFDLHTSRVAAVEDLRSAGDLIGTNAAAALAFDDASAGEKLLSALQTRPNI